MTHAKPQSRHEAQSLAPSRLGMSLLFCALLAACSGENNDVPPPPPETPEHVREFRRAALELRLRDDRGDQQAEIQYVQIGVNLDSTFRGRLGMVEAELRAADIFRQAKTGADFDNLVYQHSWEGPNLGRRPGTYLFIREGQPDAPSVRRSSMVGSAVAHAIWRLAPGEIGAVEYHRTDSESGYFVLRRLTEEESQADNPANFDPANEAIAAVRKAAAETAARPELDVSTVKVQHLLVGRYAPRPIEELKPLDAMQAEQRAAELWAQAAEADFDALVQSNTYDSHPGIYTMTLDDREGMVAGFWQTAWRLEAGEVGIVLYDRRKSPYGYHIIKRLE